MPHPRNLILKFLLLTFVVIATILLIKPNSRLVVKAAGCPVQDPATAQIQVTSGFLSLAGSSTGYGYTNGDSSSNCLVDASAKIDSTFLSYSALLQTYYTDITSPLVKKVDVTSNNIDLINNGPTTIYSVASGQAISIPATNINGVYVVFIEGSLNITGNITSSSNNGVVFVVNGPINIYSNVTEVDAFIISYGGFCDNWVITSGIGACSKTQQGFIQFNGSIISINPGTLQFSRVALDPSTDPIAEKIVYDPKYFALFKNIFSRDKTIWTEIK